MKCLAILGICCVFIAFVQSKPASVVEVIGNHGPSLLDWGVDLMKKTFGAQKPSQVSKAIGWTPQDEQSADVLIEVANLKTNENQVKLEAEEILQETTQIVFQEKMLNFIALSFFLSCGVLLCLLIITMILIIYLCKQGMQKHTTKAIEKYLYQKAMDEKNAKKRSHK